MLVLFRRRVWTFLDTRPRLRRLFLVLFCIVLCAPLWALSAEISKPPKTKWKLTKSQINKAKKEKEQNEAKEKEEKVEKEKKEESEKKAKEVALEFTKQAQKDLEDTIKRAAALRDTIAKRASDSIKREKKKAEGKDSASADAINAPVNFTATDSTVIGVKTNQIDLYNNANVIYEDMDIKGDRLRMDQGKQEVLLFPSSDSTGRVGFKDKTVFKQNESTFLSDTTRFNYSTQKSITSNTYTREGDMSVFGNVIKKVSEDEVYIKNARFSTCNLDHPHFGFVARRAKFKRSKFGATGLTFLEIEGVKVPLPIPFAMFPLIQGAKSGILPPSFDQNSSWGYGLREGGYYLKIKDYFDAAMRGSIYSFGTWTLNFRTRYKWRYHFVGNFDFDFQNVSTQLLGDLTNNSSRTFNVRYVHQVDTKSMPNSSLGININIASSQYNRLQIYNAAQNFNNSVNSSVNYSHTFKALPSSFTVSANHTQNSVTRAYNITLPSISFNMSSIQPLQMISGRALPRWYEKLTFQYTMNVTSNFSFFDTAFSIKRIIDTLRWGVQHTPSLSLPLPPAGPFVFTPGITYRENWTDHKTTLVRDGQGIMQPHTEKGFYRFYDVSYNLGVTTNIFGTFLFKGTGALKGIRHVIRPQINFNYHPDVNRKNYFDVVDMSGLQGVGVLDVVRRQGFYQDAIFGNFAEGKAANLNFNISSSLEIKVRNKHDTTGNEPYKKISIIDNFNISGAYNLLRDTLNPRRLSNIQFSLATNVLQKLQINASASLDPYSYDAGTGRMVDKFAWQDKARPFSLGRFTNFSLTLSSAINFDQSKKKKTKIGTDNGEIKEMSPSLLRFRDSLARVHGDFLYMDSTMSMPGRPRSTFGFSLNIGYNISYNERFNVGPNVYMLNLVNQNITLNGNMHLTENWSLNFSTSLNIAQNFIFFALDKIQVPYLTLGVQRRLHCWMITMNVVPLGLTRTFSIILQPASSILQDLKLQKNRSFFSQ